jgi:hypothetical protein
VQTKIRNFKMAPQDIQWLTEVKRQASAKSVGMISLSQILADLCRFARDQGYTYKQGL